MTSNRCKMAVLIAMPSYVASALPRQLRGPAFQEWYSAHPVMLVEPRKGAQTTGFCLTEWTVCDFLPILVIPSIWVKYSGIFSPDFRHPRQNVILIANNITPF